MCVFPLHALHPPSHVLLLLPLNFEFFFNSYLQCFLFLGVSLSVCLSFLCLFMFHFKKKKKIFLRFQSCLPLCCPPPPSPPLPCRHRVCCTSAVMSDNGCTVGLLQIMSLILSELFAEEQSTVTWELPSSM